MRTTKIQHGNKLVSKSKRVGRGNGSGAGAKSGRGQKGQLSRTGASILGTFEGGQTSFMMKVPKLKGFRPPNKIYYTPVNLSRLEQAFDDGAVVDIIALIQKGLVRNTDKRVKLLAFGEITKKLELHVHKVSKSAQAKIEKAGGSVHILS